jgi:hypothetical protein
MHFVFNICYHICQMSDLHQVILCLGRTNCSTENEMRKRLGMVYENFHL